MTVKDLIMKLLDSDMTKEVSIQYPHEETFSNNYSCYTQVDQFEIKDFEYGVIIGIEE